MTAADKPAFLQRIQAAAEVYRVDLSPGVIELYFRVLDDLSLDEVSQALTRHLKRGHAFMPKPSELRQVVRGDVGEKALRVFQALRTAASHVGRYRSLYVEDGATAEALRRVYGGWVAFCNTAHEDGMGEARRKEFLATYRHLVEDGPPWDPQLLSSVSSIDRQYHRFSKQCEPDVGWLSASCEVVLAPMSVVPEQARLGMGQGGLALHELLSKIRERMKALPGDSQIGQP